MIGCWRKIKVGTNGCERSAERADTAVRAAAAGWVQPGARLGEVLCCTTCLCMFMHSVEALCVDLTYRRQLKMAALLLFLHETRSCSPRAHRRTSVGKCFSVQLSRTHIKDISTIGSQLFCSIRGATSYQRS